MDTVAEFICPLYLGYERGKSRHSGVGVGTPIEPGRQPINVHRRRRRHMLESRFRQSDIATLTKAKANERLLSSSEVIESVLGKFQHIERDQAKAGFTGPVLGLAAMVSTTTVEVVQLALATVTTHKVLT